MPAELYPDYCTIEYQLPQTKAVMPPAYMFVLDTCCPEDELSAARTAITQALATLPEYAQVWGSGPSSGSKLMCRGLDIETAYAISNHYRFASNVSSFQIATPYGSNDSSFRLWCGSRTCFSDTYANIIFFQLKLAGAITRLSTSC